jgi:isopenicillin N synthase-like dioxygenase
MNASAGFRIPIADILRSLDGNHDDRLGIARQLGDALEYVDCAIVVGHGAAKASLMSTHAALRELFALPLTERMRVRPDEKAKARWLAVKPKITKSMGLSCSTA